MNSKNETPLHFSAQNGHLSVIEYLMHNGADTKTKTNEADI